MVILRTYVNVYQRASCDLMFHQELVDGSSYCTFKMSADVIAAVGDVMSDTLEALGA